jgi:crotonobetainyl-CoA:carnitine CoA-transferase CaiB-like acyl-CoA transferase
MRPLEGLTVLDVGTAMAGPYSAALLADLGADVIKVEKPRRGDLIRFTDRNISGASGYFLGVNRGKRGLTADLRKPDGQEIIRRLARNADVLVENYRSGKMTEWHLGYEDLHELNPRLVYCSLSMFPNDVVGYDQLVGNDKIAQAITGLMDNTGEADGEPTRLGAPIVDASGGFLCAIGILAALHARDRTGQGDHVLISLLEAAYALMPPWIPSILNSDVQFTRQGNKHPLLAPYQLFKSSDDRYMVVGAFHNESWRRLCRALDLPDLIEDERFTDNLLRVANRDVLDPIIEAEMAKRTAAELQKLLEEHSVPAAPVLSIRDSVEMFTSIAPQMIVRTDHAELGELKHLRAPVRLGSELDIRGKMKAAPPLGHDTDEILQMNGYSATEIANLRERHVI